MKDEIVFFIVTIVAALVVFVVVPVGIWLNSDHKHECSERGGRYVWRVGCVDPSIFR